jgi:hypothetical protein
VHLLHNAIDHGAQTLQSLASSSERFGPGAQNSLRHNTCDAVESMIRAVVPTISAWSPMARLEQLG